MGAPTPTRERKTAIVVGASRGLGLGLAREFGRRGWRVIATARNASSAKKLAAIFAASGEKIAVEQVEIDLSDYDSVDSLARRVGDRRFDLVFINAGVAGPEHQSVDATTPQEIGALMCTNAAFMSSRMGSVAETTQGELSRSQLSDPQLRRDGYTGPTYRGAHDASRLGQD